jgi:hypothetical protein
LRLGLLSLTNTPSMEAHGRVLVPISRSYITKLKKMKILKRGTILLHGTLAFYLHVLA